MRVVVFGSSGRTGRRLVEQALERGYEVTAFARDAGGVPARRERLRVMTGDVMDAKAVDEAVVGQDAVLIALGHTRTSTKDVHESGAANIVAGMKKHGVRRVVSVTGAGVRDPKDEPKLLDRVIVAALKLLRRDVLEDAERHAEVLRKSGLDWVIARGPVLNDGPRTGRYRVGVVGKNSGSRISRSDLADFMLDQLADDAYLRAAPMVSY